MCSVPCGARLAYKRDSSVSYTGDNPLIRPLTLLSMMDNGISNDERRDQRDFLEGGERGIHLVGYK